MGKPMKDQLQRIDNALTTTDYLNKKKAGQTDDEIRKDIGVGEWAMRKWKRLNGLIGVHNRICPNEVKMRHFTKALYLKYKSKNLKDESIAVLLGVNGKVISDWKRDNGLKGFQMDHWESWEKHLPKELDKLKKKFITLYNKGWSRPYIGEEMDFSKQRLKTFIDRYFPECIEKRVFKHRLTDEERRICIENGIEIATAQCRITNYGFTVEDAITKPVRKGARNQYVKTHGRSIKKSKGRTETAERKMG